MANEVSKPAVKANLTPADIKARKEALELQKKNEALEKELEELKKAKAEDPEPPRGTEAAVPPDLRDMELEAVKIQLKMLSDQMMMSQSLQLSGGKPRYKPVPPDDFQEEGVTFSSRRVFYVIGSYLNHKGVEVIPPYKLIKLQYASSDRRKDGHEESIVNSCTFTTHLKGEIDFLRKHPLYGIDFFENMNQTMGADAVYNEFRIKAASQVVAMKDESVINTCHQKGVKGVNSIGIKDLRRMLAGLYAEEYISQAKLLKDDQERRRLLSQGTIQ